MFAHLRGTHGVVLNLIQQGQQGRKLGPPRALPGCDDSLPYGLPPRPDIQTSLFRNGRPHIWTLQGHFWTVMSSRGQTLRRTGPQMKRSGGAIAPVVLTKKKAPARDILIGEPESDELRAFGGSRSDKFNGVLINAMARTGWFPPGQTDEACNQQMFAAVAALRAFKPTDEIEGMLAAQTVAMHFGAMECFRRAMVHDQQPEVASKLRKDGANLARGMTDMLDALDRKRGKGPQVVRVERVVVHEGGQAIVGNVQPAASKVGEGKG
jgi:hypothetical protein